MTTIIIATKKTAFHNRTLPPKASIKRILPIFENPIPETVPIKYILRKPHLKKAKKTSPPTSLNSMKAYKDIGTTQNVPITHSRVNRGGIGGKEG